MPTWRCPYCGTPQAETARCWVCHRSTTSCCACRNFRHAVAGHLGFCGLDRKRTPLHGDEQRGCWERATVVSGQSAAETEPTTCEAPPEYGLWAANR